MLLPEFCPLIQMGQFYAQYGRLNPIEATVASFDLVIVLSTGLTVLADHANGLSKLVIVRHHSARVAVRTQILAGKKTEAAGMPYRSDPAPLVTRAVCLRAILKHE